MTVSRISALAIGLLAAAALGLQFSVNSAETPDDSVLQVLWRMLRFFTILTNSLVCVTFLRMSWGSLPDRRWLGGVTLWIAIVGVVYHGLLARDLPYGSAAWLADLGLHTAVPVLAVLWWISFAPKALAWKDAALWLIWPLAYVVYALARGLADGVFPYFFIDPNVLGWAGVLAYSAGLCGSFWLAGLGLVGLSRRG